MKNIADFELKEKIGQMILVGFKGKDISESSDIVQVIRNVKVGGLILYNRNISNPEQVKNLIFALQTYSSAPLFIAVDAEGGRVNRLEAKDGFVDILSPKELGKINDLEVTKREALKLSQELKSLGFNMNFVPVVDLDLNPKNPIIGALGRSFSADPYKVVLHAQAFIEAHRQNNIITAAKHFPGHGSATHDSHLGKVDVTKLYKEEELIPYKLLREKGLLDAIMTAHITNRNIDKNFPATLSSNFLKNILREQIGFNGIVITDDMHMGAISRYYSFEESIIMAINAGCDIILISNNNVLKYDKNLPYEILNIIYRAVKNGKIPEQKITESFNRIYEMKKNFKIIKSPSISLGAFCF